MRKENRFEHVMRSARGQLPALFVFSFFANILLLSTPLYMLQIFDRVLSSGSTDTLIWLSIIVVIAIFVYGVIEQVRKRHLTRIGDWADGQLSPIVIKRAIQVRLRGKPSEATLDDVSDLRAFIGGDAILAFLDAPWMPIFLAVIWMLHPILGTIGVLGAILLFGVAILNDWLTRKRQGSLSLQFRTSSGAASRYIESAETVSPLGMTDALIKRWTNLRAPVRVAGVSLSDTNTLLYNLSRVMRLALQVAILGAGAALVQMAELTPGGMIAASIILARALSPVERSITAWRGYVSFRKARTRLSNLFQEAPKSDTFLELPRPEGRFVVDGVGYRPEGATTPSLKRVDFKIEPGETCGIIGPSGSGKSTLSKLLVGAYRPDFGTIRLDGADVSEWDAEHLGPYIGYLEQEIELFHGTIAENIARMGDADDEEIVAAAKLIGAHDMILKMPEGYETEIDLHGGNLSGGQRQRVGLARALFRTPRVLVFDEPNSNLDGDGELALMRAIAACKKRGCTIIIVAHQPNMLRFADKVLVIKNGVVAKFGSRDEVLQSLMKSTPTQNTASIKVAPDNSSQSKNMAGE